MTPEERQAAEAALNSMVTTGIVIVVAGWWLWWVWQRLNLPAVPWRSLEKWFTPQPPKEQTRPTPAPLPYVVPPPEPPNERTNERHHAPQRTKLHLAADALQLDRTRKGVIRVMVAAGLNVSEIRGLLKGTAADIGEEIQEAKDALARETTPLPADDPNAWVPGERSGQIVRAR